MNMQRGFRDKLEKYINIQDSFDVEMSVQGRSVYDYCCFGVDANSKLSDDRYMVFYNQPFSPRREISYNRVNNSAIFSVKLSLLPTSIERIVFTVSIDGNGTMGQIDNHKICLKQNGSEALSLLLRGSDFKSEKAIISLEIYRKGVWRVGVIAQGFNGGLGDLLRNYGGEELVEAADTVVPVPQIANSWAASTNLSANLPTTPPQPQSGTTSKPNATPHPTISQPRSATASSPTTGQQSFVNSANTSQSAANRAFQPLAVPVTVASFGANAPLPQSVAAARASGPVPSWSTSNRAATPTQSAGQLQHPTVQRLTDAQPAAMDQPTSTRQAVVLQPTPESMADTTLTTAKTLKPVSLKKGQKVSLEKTSGGRLRKAMIGLAWDEAEEVKNYYDNFDCDAFIIACQGGHLVRHEDLVYFQNLHHDSGCIIHMGDNLTGEGEGDCEQIYIDLDNLPKQYDRLVIAANIYQAKRRCQHFGMINNSYIRICDADANKELCRYELTHKYNGMTAMIFGELVRKNESWIFKALGEGTQDGSIRTLAAKFIAGSI